MRDFAPTVGRRLSMINDDQRREVAARLRDAAGRGNGERVTDGELVDVIAYAIGVEGADGFDDRLLERLADLIERQTYRPVIPDEMEGNVFCSQCGAEIGEYGVPNYCHNCGAELVE